MTELSTIAWSSCRLSTLDAEKRLNSASSVLKPPAPVPEGGQISRHVSAGSAKNQPRLQLWGRSDDG
jgi:hypothetical protein